VGYRVEAYSLDELHRISAPGAVVPSLFWMLPVGQWGMGELDECWKMFTSPEERDCHDLGLILVREHSQSDRERESRADLSQIAARLGDLVPEGVRNRIGFSSAGAEARQLLFLSGAYPQPGWGVLVTLRERRATDFVRQLVEDTLAKLQSHPGGADAIGAMRMATRAYHEFQEMKEERQEDSTPQRYEELKAVEFRGLSEKLRRLLATFEANDLTALDEARETLIGAPSASELAILDVTVLAEFKLARAVADISDDAERTNLVALLRQLSVGDRSTRGDIVRRARAANLGKVIKLWSGMTIHAPQPDSLLKWAPDRLDSLRSQFKVELNAAIARTENQLAAIPEQGQRRRAEIEEARRQRQAALIACEEKYRRSLQDALMHQWEMGPRFLMAVEAFCRGQRDSCVSVPWDPARMVGWKLWSLGIPVTVQDLHSKTRKLLGDTVGMEAVANSGIEPANGSYFTDYVHFVAMQQIGKDPREITSLLLQELLRPSEREIIFRALHDDSNSSVPEAEAVDRLLTVLGWPADAVRSERPLAGCIRQSNKQWSVLPALSGNDIRISAESFCKDMIDLMASNVGHTESELWQDVLAEHANYKRSHRRWAKEIGAITLGSAVMVMQALGPRAFAGKNAECSRMTDAMKTLSKILNPPSHHQEDSTKTVLDVILAGESIAEILAMANALASEMPWHFATLQSTGTHPKMLTGNAWSHSHPEVRMIRVLLWSGESVGQRALIWNPKRTNPIMTDTKVISRPS